MRRAVAGLLLACTFNYAAAFAPTLAGVSASGSLRRIAYAPAVPSAGCTLSQQSLTRSRLLAQAQQRETESVAAKSQYW